MSQETAVLKLLRKAGNRGVPNYIFPQRRILCYTKRISNLRKEGHDIIKERLQLPNGRYTNVFIYTLIEEKPSIWVRLKRG